MLIKGAYRLASDLRRYSLGGIRFVQELDEWFEQLKFLETAEGEAIRFLRVLGNVCRESSDNGRDRGEYIDFLPFSTRVKIKQEKGTVAIS